MIKSNKKLDHTEWVNEDEACKILQIKKNTIQNYVCQGLIKEEIIKRGVRGNKFYHAPSLKGLEN